MNTKNILLKFLIVSLPILIILNSVFLIIFNEDFFIKEIGIEKKEIIYNVIEFLKGNSELIIDLTKEELDHMYDVQNLVFNFKYFFLLILVLDILSVIYLKFKYKNIKKDILNVVKKGSLLTIGIILFFILIIFLNFKFIFVLFHEIFFDPGTWIFSSGLLITTFTAEFFRNMAIMIIIVGLVESFLLLLSYKIANRNIYK